MKRVIVIGGGITGLAAAYRLSKLSNGNYEVGLLEASDRLGGKILTENADGCIFELGPDSFLTIKPHALDLVRELGLESKLMGTVPKNSDVFVYARGRLRRIPEGLTSMAPSRLMPFLGSDLFTWRGKLRMALDWFLPGRRTEDESMGHFTRRRLGGEALNALVQPVMAGIYAGDADQMSLRSTFPGFLEMEERYGSVIRGLRRGAVRKTGTDSNITMFMTLSGGLTELTRALAGALGSVVRVGASVRTIAQNRSGYRLILDSGEEIPCDAVIATAPSWQTAEMVSDLDAELAAALREIPFASSATISLAYDVAHLQKIPHGFGFVVARDETQRVSAATFSSSKFPGRAPSETFLIRCFLGGIGREDVLKETDAHIMRGVLGDMRRLLGIGIAPRATRLCRWDRANPQYTVGHEGRLQRIRATLQSHGGLWPAGASYRGVGIPDCIASGFQAAKEAHGYLSSPQG